MYPSDCGRFLFIDSMPRSALYILKGMGLSAGGKVHIDCTQ